MLSALSWTAYLLAWILLLFPLAIKKKKSLGGRELVRGDNVNPMLIFHAQNIGSHYMSPQWCLMPIPEILTFIMTFAGYTPNAQRQPSFYGDAVAQYAALYKEITHRLKQTKRVGKNNIGH